MTAILWNDDEEQKLRDLIPKGLSDHEIGKVLGRSYDSIRRKRRQLQLPSGVEVRSARMRIVLETPETKVLAPAATEDQPASEVWDHAEKQTGKDLERAKIQNAVIFQIMTDKPIAFSISSDWHLRTRGACDLTGLRRYAEAIRDTPGAYAVAVGDLLDNPIKWEKALDEVPDDLLLLGHLFGIFGYKLAGTTDGNHDAWTRAFAGIDALKWLADRHRIHYAPDELVYQVELLDPKSHERTARYVIATRHKYYRHSNLNPTHSCFRWLEDRVGQWPVGEDGGELIPDILAIGHNHVACCEERSFMNKGIWGARMGAWQLTSGHGRAGGWRNSPPTAPTFILHPHRAQPVTGFADYERALAVLKSERAGEAA